jgi:hypothetical protein
MVGTGLLDEDVAQAVLVKTGTGRTISPRPIALTTLTTLLADVGAQEAAA